jgi:uncharacterized repeat protein (TIGR03803 family)
MKIDRSNVATLCSAQLSIQKTLLLVGIVFFAFSISEAQTFSVLYNFGSQLNDPQNPFSSGIIAQGRDGNLYSSASGGANNYYGAVYKISTAGALSDLYSFGTVSGDGNTPDSGVTLGTDGNFYGTTFSGGTAGFGTVFKLSPSGILTTLYNFTAGNDGALPIAPPIQGTDGNYYGTTCPLCNGAPGNGSIYKITPSGTFTVLYECDITHCWNFYDPLIQGTDGSFYATSEYGGSSENGTILKITSTGKPTVLYNFDGTHGRLPLGPLVQGTDGNFYGTAVSGGTLNNGVVFRITPTGKLNVIHNMNGTTDGSAPYAGLLQATDGNFYGVNIGGGASSANCPSGCGTIFKVTPTGTFTVLYNFDQATGQSPFTTPFQHTNGLIYGTTQTGGTGNVSLTCSSGNCGVLYSLNIGAAPFAGLVTSAGKVGARIGILGQNFSSSSLVTFGTVAATTVTRSGTTFLQATVPSGATTGSVTITTSAGTLTSSRKFRVLPQLQSFTPTSGPVGTGVTITGVSLTQTSKVTFGGVAASSFTVNSDTQVTATVPTGAVTGRIVITTAGGTATSSTSFTVTP